MDEALTIPSWHLVASLRCVRIPWDRAVSFIRWVPMPASFAAQIDLLAAADGGRAGPLLSGEWRTVLCVNGHNWSARLIFLGQPSPGESFQAVAQLLVPEAAPYFPIGGKFTVWEGGTKGMGRVLSIAT